MIGIVMAGGKGSRMKQKPADGKKTSTKEENETSCLQTPCFESLSQQQQQQQQEKLLLKVDSIYAPPNEKKITVIEHVINSLAHADCINKIFVAASDANSPDTLKVLRKNVDNDTVPYVIIKTKGAGYSKDLGDAIRAVSRVHTNNNNAQKNTQHAALIVSADMPYLDASVVSSISDHYAKDTWTSVVVSKSYAKMWDATLKYVTSVNGVPCCYTGVSLVDYGKFVKTDKMPQRHVIFDDHRIAFTLNTQDDYAKLSSCQWPR